MVRVIAMERAGGPDVLRLAERDLAAPGRGEVLLRQAAIGVNFVDIYHRTGLYPLPAWPAVPGIEGAGTVEAVGEGVDALKPGDRVAYMGLPVGGYAEARLLPAERLIRLPDAVSLETASAAMARGVTAHMLLHRVYPVGRGSTLLVHAAAGGLGLILVQWAKALGATVIGAVGSRGKAELAKRHGLDHAILYRESDVAAEVRALTDGRGADYVIDGIGGENLRKDFDCTRQFGTIASIGEAGGSIPPIDVFELGPRRALCLARPSVIAYSMDRQTYRMAAAAVFERLAAGLRIEIGARFALEEARQAQEALQAGRTTGSILLLT
ncbi:MAG TPA: quinone oxidoreductase [Ferrovibrio sp.]|uniref:quinone oxidoreductase family protein n=1 Tax=Ferrovibrio sp. TaxID=1917215 RepID=UPI002ED6024F